MTTRQRSSKWWESSMAQRTSAPMLWVGEWAPCLRRWLRSTFSPPCFFPLSLHSLAPSLLPSSGISTPSCPLPWALLSLLLSLAALAPFLSTQDSLLPGIAIGGEAREEDRPRKGTQMPSLGPFPLWNGGTKALICTDWLGQSPSPLSSAKGHCMVGGTLAGHKSNTQG